MYNFCLICKKAQIIKNLRLCFINFKIISFKICKIRPNLQYTPVYSAVRRLRRALPDRETLHRLRPHCQSVNRQRRWQRLQLVL